MSWEIRQGDALERLREMPERCPTCGSPDPTIYYVPVHPRRPVPIPCPDPFHSLELREAA